LLPLFFLRIYKTSFKPLPTPPLLDLRAMNQPEQMPPTIEQRLSGLYLALNEDVPDKEDIDDDIEGEQGTLPDLEDDDLNNAYTRVSPWRDNIGSVCKGVLDSTDGEYQR
jgi:hypothetical protein